MFRNRKLTVTMDKVNGNETTKTSCDDKTFEKKTEVIRRSLEGLGAKMFLGVCVYVLLDTHRQVSVERAKHPNS